jgi:hypothetical protein
MTFIKKSECTGGQIGKHHDKKQHQQDEAPIFIIIFCIHETKFAHFIPNKSQNLN